MDPYLLARIGDVTIQRVLPKQDTPKKETSSLCQISPAVDSTSVELDLSMKTRSCRDKGEDEGGGGAFGGGSKNSNYSDASDEEEEGDISEEMDDEDEQEAPLSLVTTKRNQDECVNTNPLSTLAGKNETIKISECNEKSQNQVSSTDFDQNKQTEKVNSIFDQNECMDPNKESPDSTDIDDDMPLSRLVAESENLAGASDGEAESDVEDEKLSGMREKAMNEGDEDADGEGDEVEEPEEDDEPENLVKAEDPEQEDQGSGDEDPDREMIVVKQEPFDDDDDESIKRKMTETDEDTEDKAAKKSKSGSGNDSGSESESNSQSGIDKTNAERKLLNLRKNIREVMDENQLDEATLAAQRQEMERLQRVQEQQRIIREVNRQINLNRQNTKTQTRVISLLQSGGASLLKASPPGTSTSPKSTSPNTVLVKLSSGSGPPQVVNKKVLEILRSTKSASSSITSSKATALANKLLNKPHSLTPSVSIAPVKPGLTITKMGKSPGEEDKTVAAVVRKVTGKPKQKGKDVVTISSSSSDEDDCILISEPSGGEEEEEEDDPTNSGMHTNDLYNVPDDQGRVLINVGRPENEPDVFLAPQIARIIKPHQIGGVRFLFDNVVESLERFKTSPGFGCILAHSMGLGKTLQVVSFCDVFLRYTEGKTVLCIMPINTLQNWMAEFNMWLPVDPAMSPFAVQGEIQPRTFPLFVLNDLQKSIVARAKVVIQWAKEGGVLLIGYELYRQLSLQKPRKRRCNSKRKINPDDDIDDEKNKHLLEEMHEALVKPGPDLVICDEGHRIKNSHASISQALKQIRSKRRVVLTGYPLQNNLLEYWCMVDFVRPNYLGTKTEFSNMFERPIQNGQCIDSTPQDIRLMRYRAHVLHSLLEGFVQRRSHSVLTHALPQKEEYVILVRMTTFQRTLYDTFMNEVVRTKAVPNPLKAFAVCCKIWNHPDVLYHFLRRRMMGAEAVDLDLEETAGAMVPIPGSTVVPVMPVKRGRGRSPKGISPIKRERKVNPRKRGIAEPDSPVKSPVVAAVMPNTTNSNHPSSEQQSLQSHPSSQSLQSPDNKPVPNMQQFSQQPSGNQFRPNFPYSSTNNSFPSQYSGMNPNYQNFNQQQQNDFHSMPPPYPGFQNQQGFNNQNMYSGFGGNYYSQQQDPSFNGGNYWNNQYFSNEHSNPGMFPNYNESDSSSSTFYNQELMGSDGFNGGHRGYNSGMSMNRPGMSGNNPLQQGRMGINNPGHGMMGMNSNMGGMNMNSMNSMGIPMNNMNPSGMSMNQNNFGMNSASSMGMNTMSSTSLGMNSQSQAGMNMGQSNMGMNHQSQGMGMNQMSGMGLMGSQGQGSLNVPSAQGHIGMNNQNNGMGMNISGMNQVSSQSSISQSGMSSHNPTSGSMHTMTNSQVNLMSNSSNQSAMENQQQAAIENIANNLMMSSQQSMQSTQGLLGGSDNHNANNPNNPSNIQNAQQSRGNTQNLTNPSHDSQGIHVDGALNVLGNAQGMQSNTQNLMGGMQNQQSQLSSMQSNSQNQGNPTVTSQNQSSMMQPSQSSHMMANMISSSQSSQNIPGQHGSQNLGSFQAMGSSPHDGQNMMTSNQHPQNMIGTQQNPTSSANQQNMGNMQSQQGFIGNQSHSSSMMGNMQNSMFRSQQPNQTMFGQQGSLPMMGSQQGMFGGGNNQPMHHMIGSPQNPLMNQLMMSNQHNMLSGGGMSGLDQTGSQQSMLTNQPNLDGNQQGMMGASQNQNMIGNQDSSMSSGSTLSNMSTQQNLGSVSGNQQGSHNNSLTPNMFGSQTISNPMGNLQNMLNNQNMMSSQNGAQNITQTKAQSDLSNSQDTSHQSLMGMNQNINNSAQQNIAGNQSGMMMNQQSGLNDSVIGQNMISNQQHSTTNPSSNTVMDSQQNIFGMNPNQINQPGFLNNQNMMGHNVGNSSNVMNNQPLMGGSQNMGMMMNNSTGQGMYGNQMNSHDMVGGPSNITGNQMTNPSFNPNQLGGGNNMMGMYHQSGMMNYPGMMMGNQMNNFGMMNQQQNTNNPNLMNQNPTFGNNMMRNPSAMMGIRTPQSFGGMNPDMNQGMMSNNFTNNQNNFGMFGNNNMAPNTFNPNPNNPENKGGSASTQSNSTTTNNNRFMSGGEFHSGNSQSSSQDHGNLSQSAFNNDFSNFGLNSEDSKMWDDINKCAEKTIEANKPEKVLNASEQSGVKKEAEVLSEESKVKPEGDMSDQTIKSELEESSPKEKYEGEELKKEESKSPKAEGGEGETKECNPDVTGSNVATAIKSSREDAGIPYDWATELLKGYVPGNIEASAKMALLFCILEESMYLGDRVLVFSQSLFTLDLIEDFLQKTDLPGRQEKWARNWNYYRLDGSTSAMEREKLINEFNSNPNIHLFLVSTRAGSLGINLVGANRVVVLDASWNPCHDTQAVCRVYRYGQRKPCFVYRLVTDNCLEKKIYDRQINKQGMADRVVDECNPDAHLSIKEVTNLCWDNEEDSDAKDFSNTKHKYIDVVMQKLLDRYSKFFSKEPFQHESLLVDRKEKKLSQAEKRLAKRSYELEKQATINNTRPVYGYYPGNTSGVGRGNPLMKPMASVRPMQSELNNQLIRDASSGRPRQWIPAEVWQKQGMSAQEMTLPLDVVIPTNSPDRSSIVLKAGQKVMVLKSPKGIYMQLENGKIIAIRTAFKVGGKGEKKGAAAKGEGTESGIKKMVVQPTRQRAPASLLPLRNNSNISIIPRGGAAGPRGPNKPLMRLLGSNRGGNHKQPVATAKPYFGESSAHPPVTVTVTKKRIGSGTPQASTSTAQVEIRREPKQVTVTPIPPSSPKITAALLERQTPRTSTESVDDSSDSSSTKTATQVSSDSEQQPTLERKDYEVECPIEIKPIKAVPDSGNSKENSTNKSEDVPQKIEDAAVLENVDKKHPILPQSLTKESTSIKISIEERAKMEPSLQPVVSLKNYRHLAFQNNKTVVLSEVSEKNRESNSSSKVVVNPLPFKTGSSLSISPVTIKSSLAASVEPTCLSSSISIEPVKLPPSTSVNLVKPHSSFSVTPASESDKKSEEPKEHSMSITKITEKPPTTLPSTTTSAPVSTVTPSKSNPPLSVDSPETQTTLATNIFPLPEAPKSNLPVQPSASGLAAAPQMSAFNPAMDFSLRPDFQQQLPNSRTGFYGGFPRPPLGYPTGNFFPPRKDASGKDLPSSLPQFPAFDAANYINPNPFSAAAAGSNFPPVSAPRPNNTFTSSTGMIQPSSQPAFESDFSRMYSAFHRPEPQQVGFPTPAPLPPSQYNPYSYNPFLMHAGFPLPGTNPQPSTTPNPSNTPSQ